MDPLYLFVFTNIASTEGFLTVSTLILIFLVVKQKSKQATLFFTTTAGLMLSTGILKETLRIPRPENALIEVAGYALPSGHASGSAFLALCICYLARNFKKPLRYSIYIGAVLITLAVGISRIQFGVHTPFQVGVGYLLGIVWAIAFIAFSSRVLKIPTSTKPKTVRNN